MLWVDSVGADLEFDAGLIPSLQHRMISEFGRNGRALGAIGFCKTLLECNDGFRGLSEFLPPAFSLQTKWN